MAQQQTGRDEALCLLCRVALSAFVATFAYSAAGLYTVRVSGGSRTASYARLAVSGAIGLLFISLDRAAAVGRQAADALLRPCASGRLYACALSLRF